MIISKMSSYKMKNIFLEGGAEFGYHSEYGHIYSSFIV